MSKEEHKQNKTDLQSFEVEQWDRGSIQNAPYNPRTIDDYAKRKLRENLKRVGLLQPIVVNRTSGNIVSGHQRLAVMDAIEGSDEYSLDVSVVELDDKTEKEQNAFMNNPSAMGTWDVDALQNLVNSGEFDWQLAGFDKLDLEVLIDDIPDEEAILANAMTPEAEELMETYGDHASRLHGDRLENKDKFGHEIKDGADIDLDDDEYDEEGYEQGDDYEQEKEDWRELKAKYKERKMLVDNPDFFCCLVFDTFMSKNLFFEYLEMGGGVEDATKDIESGGTKYIDGNRLFYNIVFSCSGEEAAEHAYALAYSKEYEDNLEGAKKAAAKLREKMGIGEDEVMTFPIPGESEEEHSERVDKLWEEESVGDDNEEEGQDG